MIILEMCILSIIILKGVNILLNFLFKQFISKNYQDFKGNNNLSNDNAIIRLKNELNKANKIIEEQKLTIEQLRDKINNFSNIINKYQNIILQKDLEINNLRKQLNNISNKPSDKIFKNEIMCVNFISMDQKVHFAAPCIKTDTFAEIEEKLYKQYPAYRETNNTFIANGTQILRFKTIEENKIGNGLPVTLIVPS